MAALAVNTTLGAALIGFTISCILFGILSVGVFTYYKRYPCDLLGYKLLVAVVWLLEFADQGCIGHFIYHYMISNFTNPSAFFAEDIVWTLLIQVLVGASAGTLVKCCFAFRIWKLSLRNFWITVPIVILSLGQLALATTYTVKSFSLRKLIYANQLKLLASLSLGIGAFTDILTSIILTYYLRKLRTGYSRSDLLVDKLILYTMNTGALTSLTSVGALVFYDVHPQTLEFVAFYFALSKLYAVSLMCTLNTRKVVYGQGTDRELSMDYSSNPNQPRFVVSHHSRHTPLNPMSSQTKSQLEVGVHQEVSITSEGGLEFTGQERLELYSQSLPRYASTSQSLWL